MSFEPFGWRRSWNTMANLDAASASAFNTRPRTSRGFTGHEQVDNLGLIHMNGRMYDPWVGRFVQADPIVQDYGNPQSLNRYSYVLNNPLSFTDPTGYASMNATWRSVVAIAVIAFSGGWAAGLYASLPALSTSAAWAVAISGGAIAGAVQTGTMRGAMIGAVSAAAFHGIGSYYRSMAAANAANGTADAVYRGLTAPQFASNVALSSVAGGVMSDLQGGKFGHGMVSAGLSTAASPAFDHISMPAGQVVVAAIIGGTASSITGGRFANGAVTAAFAFASSSIMRQATAPSGDIPLDLSGVPTDELRSQMTSNNPADRIAAAKAAIKYFSIKGSQYKLGYIAEQKEVGTAAPFGQITLGPLAYRSWSFLGAILGHEIEAHWEMQFKVSGPYKGGEHRYMREIQAFKYSVSNIPRFGNSEVEARYFTGYRDLYYRAVSTGNRNLADKDYYESQ